jgi:hypothetical protein
MISNPAKVNYLVMPQIWFDIANAIGLMATQKNDENFPSSLPFIFDMRMRQCVALAEEYRKYYVTFNKTGDKKDMPYIIKLDDLYNFIVGKDSYFPYSISELHSSAYYVFYAILYQQVYENSFGGGAAYDPLFGYTMNDEIWQETVAKYLQPYIDNFPTPNR